jgi:hypothetical protein
VECKTLRRSDRYSSEYPGRDDELIDFNSDILYVVNVKERPDSEAGEKKKSAAIAPSAHHEHTAKSAKNAKRSSRQDIRIHKV